MTMSSGVTGRRGARRSSGLRRRKLLDVRTPAPPRRGSRRAARADPRARLSVSSSATAPQGLVANSVPFFSITRLRGSGRLRSMSRAPTLNGAILPRAPDALVVFQGHDHYITPSWYATKRETGKVVPTWNYAMVQASGPGEGHGRRLALPADRGADPARRRSAREALGGRRRARGFHRHAAPARSSASKSRSLDIRGKWKTSQNRNAADRAGVAAGLDGAQATRRRGQWPRSSGDERATDRVPALASRRGA